MSQRTITIPMSREAPRCEGPDASRRKVRSRRSCHLPANGVYKWETVHFGNVKQHAALLCATCSTTIANRIQAYEDTHGELQYSKPNKNLTLHTLFTYEKPVEVVPTPEPHPKLVVVRGNRRLAAPVGRALLRNALHDQRVDVSNYRGNPNARWYHTVECPACHVKFTRANARKRCPGCGGKV